MRRTEAEIEAVLAQLARHGPSGLEPSDAALRRLLAADLGGPLQYLNLLAYYEVARYPDGHELAARRLSGAEAYALYGKVAMRHVMQRGGRLALFNDVALPLVGADGGWHQIAIMQYPDVDAFVDMLCDPDYAAALVHRDAGLARTEIWVTRPLLPGA